MKPRKSIHRLWALYGRNGGSVVTSGKMAQDIHDAADALTAQQGRVPYGNVPALYWSKKEAWYDGDDDLEVRQVIVEVRELPRRRKGK